MKILLIYPYCLDQRIVKDDISVVPIGLFYIAALLKENNYDVEILNWYDINKRPHKIKEILIEKKPDIIGFSIFQANRWGGIEISKTAKELNPDVKIVFGGVGATFLWKHLLDHFSDIDFIVLGEGEYTFLNLIRYIEKNESVENIKGIALRKNGKSIKTPAREQIKDLDKLPHPAKYFKYQYLYSTRGCPGNCTFCGSPQFWGRKVRFHSPEYFVNELELFYKQDVTLFYFSDDTFTLNKKRVIEICKKILEKNLKISWIAISRVDNVDEEILYWMRKAGCIQISYGVESGSQKIRKILNKQITNDQIKKAFSLTTKYGILARAYFIYGNPEETLKTIQESIDLILEIKPLSIIFYILDIFPGTALYSDFQKKTKSNDDIWLKKIEDIMYFETDPKLNQKDVLTFGEKLRQAHYKNLHNFVKDIELVDDKEFYEKHSEFCSKLGMTFSHGDYSRIDAVKNKENTAKFLFKKALSYYPNSFAYLGLGMIEQKNMAFDKSVKILSKGISYFPEDEQLHLCLGISYMNMGMFDNALSVLLKIQNSKDALYYILCCYKELGNHSKEAEFQQKLEAFSL
ncbi:anaerobic magnesium-protoporphyrin IX monomethyl ester cyclase [Candidatus Magnetomoraceae bacterium gMMP-15]